MPTTFANTINSNPIYADRAEKDAAGNTISTTYATTASLATVATSGDYDDLQNKPAIPTVPSAGNMLSVTNGVLNVTTTAGITDVQQVNALPAQTVATVLYLIPET